MDFNPFLSAEPGASGAIAAPAGPPLTIVAGGSRGVGATTVAMRLSTALAGDAQRVVLIDADLDHPDIAERCGLVARASIHEVLMAKRTIHEALQRGSAGIQVLTGSPSPAVRPAWNDRGRTRLEKQLGSLTPHADQIVVDTGGQTGPLAAALWQRARLAVLVTTPAPASIMEGYALLKTLIRRRTPRPDSTVGADRSLAAVELFVNGADRTLALDVHRRFDQSCRRFLGLGIGLAGWLPSAAMEPVDPAALEAIAMTQLAQRIAHAPPESAAAPRVA